MNITIKPLKETDIDLLSKWLYKDHVAKFFKNPLNWLDEINKRDNEYSFIKHFIIYDNEIPIGFAQYYDYQKGKETFHNNFDITNTYSIDYMIGEEFYLNKHIGSKIVGLLTELVINDTIAYKIIVQPNKDNIKSRNSLLGAGYSYDDVNDIFYIDIKDKIYKCLDDNEYDYSYIDHTRHVARAIVIDDQNNLYFVHASRNDDFGKCDLIETSGGGIEAGESPEKAIVRELKEELGVDVDIITKIGIVSDYYNLIHRHNINNYYLCKIKSFGDNHLTEDEINTFHLSKLKLSYIEALNEYKRLSNTKLGKLIYNREVQVLEKAYHLILELKEK